MSTITTSISTGVSLGSGAYPSPLTIAAGGIVNYTGASNAIYGGGTLVNLGTVAQGGVAPSAGYGVYLTSPSAILNGAPTDTTALIQGGGGLSFGSAAPAAIANYGTIHGYHTSAIVLAAGGTIGNGGGADTGARIQGYAAAISSTGTNSLTITNAGTLQATNLVRGAYAVAVNGAATITNTGSAALITGDGGISIALAGTILNSGEILVAPGGYTPVQIGGSGYVANLDAGAVIAGFGGVSIGQAGTVENAGTITLSATGGVYFGVDINAAGTVVNTGTAALISGYTGGVSIAQGGTVSNAGTIRMTGSYSHGYAIVLGGAGSVSNIGSHALMEGKGGVSIAGVGTVSNGGSILATYYRGNFGVFVAGGGYIGNTGTGAIIAGYGGAYAGHAATIVNAGTIESNQYSALGDNFGVHLAHGGTVINSGAKSLLYGSVALYIAGAAGTVLNTGQITANEGLGAGVKFTAGGTLQNGASGATAAVITGKQYGVLDTAGPVTIVNYGDISGTGVGLQLDAGGTVVTSGTIGGGQAIAFGAGNDLLVLRPGYVFSGGIAGGGTGNTVELQGNVTASVTANYSSLALTDFQAVAFAPGAGAYADLVIGNTAQLPGTIVGFTGANDKIDLTGLLDSANTATASFNAGTDILTVTGDTGSVNLQLGAGSYSGITWAATNDGANGTLVYRSSGGAAPNVRPTIGGTAGNLAVPTGSGDSPFAAVAIADASPSPTDTVTVTLSNPAGGTLSNLGSGSFDAATGVYSTTGTPTAVTTDIRGLVFTPAAPAAGAVATPVSLTIAVTGPGGTTSDSTTTVTAVTQIFTLATIAPASIAISASPDGSTFAAAALGQTNEAVVLNPTAGNVYDLPTGYQAEFLGASADAVTLNDPSTGHVLLVGNASANTISSGAAYDTLLGGAGTPTLQFTATAADGIASIAGGNVVLLDAGSHDSMIGGTGTTTATLSGASGTFYGQAGVSSVTATGQNAVLAAGASRAFFQFGTAAAGDVVFGGAGALSLIDAGKQDTVLGATAGSMATLSGAQALFLGSSGNASIQAGGYADTVAAGTGTTAVTLSGTNAQIFGNGGLAVLDAGSKDTIAAFGASSASVSLTGSGAVVLGGSSSLAASISGSGTGNTVLGGAGATTATVAGSANLVFGGGGALSVNDSGSTNTVAGFGAGPTDVTVTGANALLLGGSHGMTASLAGSGATIAGGTATTDIRIDNIFYTTADLVLGGAGALTVVDSGQHDTIAAFAASSAHVSIGGTRNLVMGGANALNVSIGGGTNTVLAGAGAASIVAANTAGGTELIGGSGSLAVQDAGTGDTIAPFGASSASVTLSGSNTLLFGGANPMSVNAAGAGATIAAGTGALAVTATGSGGPLVFGSGAPLSFVGGAGSATVMAGTGDATIAGGSGGVVLFGAAGGSVTYTGSSGGLTYSAGTGNETLDARTATSDNIMFSGSGADCIVGGTGNDTLVGGAGADTLVGSASPQSQDVFVLFSGKGGAAAQEVVSNFTASDQLLLVGYGAGAAQTAIASAVSALGATTITLSDNTTITFTDTASGSLTGHIVSF